jgi:hypothetical protein
VLLRIETWKPTCAALATVVLASIGIGCGGSGEAEPLTKPAFMAQASAVCAKAQTAREGQRQELAELGGDSGAEDPAAVMDLLLKPVEEMSDELGDLGPPKGEEAEVGAIVSAYEEGAAELEADPVAGNAVTAFDRANRLAAAYGLTECAI